MELPKLTTEQIMRDNVHFKGKITVNTEIYRNVYFLQYTHCAEVKSENGFQASYLFDCVKYAWELGSN